MALQQGRDVPVSFKTQAALGTEEASGGGATKFLYKDGSQGFSPPQAALIESTVNLGDGMTARSRRGSYNVPGQMLWEGNCRAHDLIYPTFWRNAFSAAITVDQDALSPGAVTLSVASNVITFSAGDVSAEGVAPGDCVNFSAGLDAADNGKWLPVIAVTPTAITVGTSITNVAGPVSTWSFVRPKKLLQGTASNLITVEEYFTQIDRSLVVHDVKGSQINFALAENQTLDITGDFLAAGYAYKNTGSSPHFTSPTEPAGDSLAFLDAGFVIGGTEYLTVTGFNIGLDVAAQTLAVANRTGRSPDVFQGNGKPSGQWSMAYDDFTVLESAAAETQIDFIATFHDPNGTGVLQLAANNVITTNEQLSALGTDGAGIQTFDMEIGRDARGGVFDRTGLKLLLAS